MGLSAFVIVVFPDHTHLLVFTALDILNLYVPETTKQILCQTVKTLVKCRIISSGSILFANTKSMSII